MFLDFLAFTMYLSISVEHYEHIIYVVDFMLGMGWVYIIEVHVDSKELKKLVRNVKRSHRMVTRHLGNI